MSTANYMAKLKKLEGAVVGDYDPRKFCLRSQMPSVNWTYNCEGGGIPFGFSTILYGPPKGGKTLIANTMIGWLHQAFPESIAVVYNTELRSRLQNNEASLKIWGIDPERYMSFDVNSPALIFDKIEQDIAALCEEGAQIKVVVIDSITQIMGRRTENATSVNQQQIGDHAKTVLDGLRRILPVIRKFGIALILTDHVRAELDQHELMRGNTVKMASAWGTKHIVEFFGLVEPNKAKSGRCDLTGIEFVDVETKDFMDKSQKTGHKIRFTMKDTSIGKPGRTAEFTLDYDRGVINTHEEVFTLAVNGKIIERPNNTTYVYKDMKWRGLPAILTAMKDSPELTAQILDDFWTKEYGAPYSKVASR